MSDCVDCPIACARKSLRMEGNCAGNPLSGTTPACSAASQAASSGSSRLPICAQGSSRVVGNIPKQRAEDLLDAAPRV